MKITLLVVGKTTDTHIELLIQEYQKRLAHYIPFNIQVIPELKNTIGFEHKHPHHHLDVWQHTLEVLKNLSYGMYNKEIAEELFITEATVITHIRHLYQKLEITEHRGHGGATYRVRAVLKFFELQKQGVI